MFTPLLRSLIIALMLQSAAATAVQAQTSDDLFRRCALAYGMGSKDYRLWTEGDRLSQL